MFKKGDHKQCTHYRRISLLSLPAKVYAKCLERKWREIVESKPEDGQCCFRKQIFENCWEYGKDLFACFVDLKKANHRVPQDKLWKVLREYGVNGQLLRAIKSFHCRPEVCVRSNGKQSKPFHMLALDLGKRAFSQLSFSLCTWIGSTNAAKLMSA